MLSMYIFFHTILLYNRANENHDKVLVAIDRKKIEKANPPIKFGNIEYDEPPKYETCRNTQMPRNFDRDPGF
jgi:hypothetical protein